MFGKLLGLGGAGLLQVGFWSIIGIVALLILRVNVAFELPLLVFAIILFILTYAFYGSLLLAVGSVGTNERECTQIGGISLLFLYLPFFFIGSLMFEPHGTLARIFTCIPFTAPVMTIFRLSLDPYGTPLLDIVLVILIMMLSAYLALIFAARVFRVAILMYGKRPSIKEIARWVFQS
jgi:ABC-2 type transport system permease protein